MTHRMFPARAASLVGAALLAAMAASPAVAGGEPMTVQLGAQNASGEKGTATFTPEGDKTRVVIELSGVPTGVAQPAHVHEGSCDKLDPKPKIPLNNVVNGKSSTLVGVGMDQIAAGSHAVNVHKSAQDLKTYVACGNISKK